jgi:MFS family permease
MALGGFKEVFRIRDFSLLFWGQAISALGDWVGTLAFIAAAQGLAPGKPAAVVGVLILRLVPSFFATPIGGVLSDRWDRQRIMIWSDVIRFGVILFARSFTSVSRSCSCRRATRACRTSSDQTTSSRPTRS